MTPELLQSYIGLTLLPNVGNILSKHLISYCGGVQEVFTTPKNKLLQIPDIGPKIAQSITEVSHQDRIEEELKFIEKNDIQVFGYLDDEYPQRLKECRDSPLLLYYKGNVDPNAQKVISIVGTRRATDYGKDFCRDLVQALQKHNVLIVSGLAYGIDGLAHKTAVEEELPTIGVLGHGLDRIYPAPHRQLASQMMQNGGLLTEFPSQTQPERENFPKRNRIIAGLADAVVVVESGRRGGAIITAELANSYHRDVFALPGNIHAKKSKGCNHLIKSHQAALIESVQDIEYILRWEQKDHSSESSKRQLQLNLNEEEQKIVNVLKEEGEVHIDSLTNATNLPMAKISNLLLQMEVSGIVKSKPGNKYKLS